MKHFDLIVIGSGPAGFSAAMRAFDFGLKVCLVEGGNIGGAGIMNGALSSKTMYELSMDYVVASRTDRGYRGGNISVDFNHVKKTVIDAVKEKQYQMLSQIETFHKDNGRGGSVELVFGWASFIDKSTIEVKTADSTIKLKAKDFIVATGSKPRSVEGIEVDNERIVNSDGILNLKKFPERMLIVGSGIIGCEFATIFSNFKQTKVHILDRANRVLPSEDLDVSNFVSKNLQDSGVEIHHTAKLRGINKRDNHLEVILDYDAGNSRVLEVDVALIAVGREVNFDGLGIENIGAQIDEFGKIKVDEQCLIFNNSEKCNIYAAGDVTYHSQLYSVAEMQGRLAAERIASTPCHKLDYNNMATLMFFKPELASIGFNEKQLRANKVPHKVAYYSNKLLNRAIAMRNVNGFVKIIVSNEEEPKILGIRAAGPQASAYISSMAHLMHQKSSIEEVLSVFYPHPSIAEGIQECIRSLSGKSIFKPKAFPDLIKVKKWTP